MLADTTKARQHRSSAFDPAVSLRLDQVIIVLDAQPPGLRRRWLQLRKRILEIHVPAFYPKGGAR